MIYTVKIKHTIYTIMNYLYTMTIIFSISNKPYKTIIINIKAVKTSFCLNYINKIYHVNYV